MSVNTSDDYLDELLQAIEPIIYPNGVPTENSEFEEAFAEPAGMPGELPTGPTEVSAEPQAEAADMSIITENEPVEILAKPEMNTVEETVPEVKSFEEETEKEVFRNEEERSANSVGLGDLLASMSSDEETDSGFDEEDIESMLNAVSQAIPEANEDEHNQDVKDLLKLFTEDEDLSDIQDMLDRNDNGEAVDESLLDIPDVEVFQMEEDADDTEEEGEPKAKRIGKLLNGFTGIFKRKKKQKRKKGESDDSGDLEQTDGIGEESEDGTAEEIELSDDDTISLLDEDAEEEIILDEDMSDIDMLLSKGALQGAGASETEDDDSGYDETDSEDKSKKKKEKKKKEKKAGLFSKLLDVLTEEIEEPKKGVPETNETGITDENRDILEELSKEEKKKAKLEKKNAKKGGTKKSSKKGEDNDADDKGKKAKKPKKEKKKREKKEKPVKEKVPAKPEKKLPKRRVMAVFALCFSILAAVLILQNVFLSTTNLKAAKTAYDKGDYITCFTNLEYVDRDEEEENLYQKSLVILSVQRKLDAYNNYILMSNEKEALNSLLEGVKEYRKQESLAMELGVHGQIMAIYQAICEKLIAYNLSEADVDEILNYESKVTYTKRINSIIYGTPFIIEETVEAEEASQPLEDVLPWEEDFLPDDTTIMSENMQMEEAYDEIEILEEEYFESEADTEDSYIEPQGQTVVVGSNPVDISGSSQDNFGGQNVGSGGTNVSVEVDGGNVVVGGM